VQEELQLIARVNKQHVYVAVFVCTPGTFSEQQHSCAFSQQVELAPSEGELNNFVSVAALWLLSLGFYGAK
jgi:hypothetical protein